MKRKAVVVWRSCISSRPDKLNEASIYKLSDVLAGGSLFDTKSFHLKRRKLKIAASSCSGDITGTGRSRSTAPSESSVSVV